MTITKLELVRFNQVLDISDESNFVHAGNSGFGMPPLHRLSERGPLQHGVTDLGFRLDPRTIQLVLAIHSSDWDNQYYLRNELLRWLNPALTEPIHLKFTTSDGTVMQIECQPSSGPIYQVGEETDEHLLKFGLTLIAPDPLFHSEEKFATTISGSVGVDGFPVPVELPMSFSGGSITDIMVINYDGTWIEFPEIELIGQMDDPVITHLETGLKLDLTNYDIGASGKLFINLAYGYKTVVDHNGTNRISALSADSDLTSWHLRVGTNNVQVSATNINATARFVLRYYYRYLGV